MAAVDVPGDMTGDRWTERRRRRYANYLCIRSSAVAEGPRDALCQWKSCQLLRNSAETTCTKSPEQIEVTGAYF